jgi:hypothetical protein
MNARVEHGRARLMKSADPARFIGQEAEQRAGLKSLKVHVKVDRDAAPDVLSEWPAKVEARCPIADDVRSATPTALVPVLIRFLGVVRSTLMKPPRASNTTMATRETVWMAGRQSLATWAGMSGTIGNIERTRFAGFLLATPDFVVALAHRRPPGRPRLVPFPNSAPVSSV